MAHLVSLFQVVMVAAADPISTGLDSLKNDVGGWIVALAALAGASSYGLHAIGYRHGSDTMRTAFVGLGGAAILVYGASWLLGLFHP